MESLRDSLVSPTRTPGDNKACNYPRVTQQALNTVDANIGGVKEYPEILVTGIERELLLWL